MPDLIVAAAPTPSSQGAAKGSSAPDATGRNNESTSASQGAEGESSFASTLKSRMESGKSEGGKEKSAKAAEKKEEAQPADAASVANAMATAVPSATDVAALLPLIEAALSGKLPGMQPQTADAATDETLKVGADETATSALPIAVTSGPTTTNAAQAGPARREDGETVDLPLTSAQARPTNTPAAGEKLAADTAIAADVAATATEATQRDLSPTLQPRDFQAIMDRAVAASQNGAAHAQSNAVPAAQVNTPVGQAGWHEEVGQKLTWMVGAKHQQADLVLTPPQLGRIEVSLTVTGDQATAVFSSANPAVREALESSVHRLREVLADAGVTLGQTQVGAESFRQPGTGNENGDNRHFARADGEGPEGLPLAAVVMPQRISAGRGMVDVFA